MIVYVSFEEADSLIKTAFEEVHDISDGGYERGYSEGEKAGYAKGEQAAKAEAETANAQILAECNAEFTKKDVKAVDSLEQVPPQISETYERGKEAGMGEGVEIGKQAERYGFISRYQEYGNRKDYTRTWAGTAWDDETFTPIYDMQPTACTSMFEGSKITNLKAILERCGVTLDFSKVAYGQAPYLFRDSDITDVGIIDLSGYTSYNYVFNNSTKLVNVEKVILKEDGSTKLGTAMFTGAVALVEIRIEGVIAVSVNVSSAVDLSNASAQSFIEHLADLTGLPSQKITFHSSVLSKLTPTQTDAILAKNWYM